MKTRPDNYGRGASALHWLIGLALIGQIVFGFLLDDIAPRKTPSRGFVINLHKSFGITLGLLIVLRLWVRLRQAAPAWPSALGPAEQAAARLGHRALYACMVLMPLSGYVASNFSKHGVKFFGFGLPPWGADLPVVYGFFNALHVYTAWAFTALVAGHVAMACKHVWVDRSFTFSRISPWAQHAGRSD